MFAKRKKALQNTKWLRPTLLVIDFILLVAGLLINSVLGFVLGLLFILINEFFTPMVIEKVFLQETSGELRPTGRLTKKVIRGSTPRNKKKD